MVVLLVALTVDSNISKLPAAHVVELHLRLVFAPDLAKNIKIFCFCRQMIKHPQNSGLVGVHFLFGIFEGVNQTVLSFTVVYHHAYRGFLPCQGFAPHCVAVADAGGGVR